MGDPVRDPHGDPIPTRSGRLPPSQGVPLSSLKAGETATVTHLEDEPEPVFRRLVSLGFQLAVPVKVTRKLPIELELLVGGQPVTIHAHEAGAVTVERVAEALGHTALFERLDALREGERAEVVEIAPAVQGAQRRRLLDLGVVPGTEITAEVRSPSGDPTAYRIRGALIALRRAQAHGIYIRRAPTPAGLAAASTAESGAP
jgi:DtxR family Mn-dependent transcriptional regulator